jgi:TRAP-type C4-dicarboxylate transport system permease small subunit
MSRNASTHPNSRTNAVGLERSLGLITLPVVLGLITLRQVEHQFEKLGQLTESLLQGEKLPILDRRGSSKKI